MRAKSPGSAAAHGGGADSFVSFQATAGAADRFALPAPAFIASVCSRSKSKTLNVRVVPLPPAVIAAKQDASISSQPAASSATHAQQQQQHNGEDDLALAAGDRFWAMPVCFIATVHSRQVEALASLAAPPSGKPPTAIAAAPTAETGANAAPSTPGENHILSVLTFSDEVHKTSRTPKEETNVAAFSDIAETAWALAAQAERESEPQAALLVAPPSASAERTESPLTPRQREAVAAATALGSRIVTVEGALRHLPASSATRELVTTGHGRFCSGPVIGVCLVQSFRFGFFAICKGCGDWRCDSALRNSLLPLWLLQAPPGQGRRLWLLLLCVSGCRHVHTPQRCHVWTLTARASRPSSSLRGPTRPCGL